MIRCNLSVLLAQRNMSITELSKLTNISRTTLNSLEKNYSTGIQFSTVDKICHELDITPSDLIQFYPIDFNLYFDIRLNEVSNGTLTIIKRGKTFNYDIKSYLHHNNPKSLTLDIYLGQDDIEFEDTDFIEKIYNSIPVEFKFDLEKDILHKLNNFCIDYFESDIDFDSVENHTPDYDYDFYIHFYKYDS